MTWLRRLLGLFNSSRGGNEARALVDEINAELTHIREAGSAAGAHYTDHVERVKELRRQKRHSEAIGLLLKLIDATETEARAAGRGWGVAPWYCEQLAIVYRKEKRFADEVAILERYDAQPKAPGVGPAKLAKRLKTARKMAASRDR